LRDDEVGVVWDGSAHGSVGRGEVDVCFVEDEDAVPEWAGKGEEGMD
jgi:hypothetical protein